MKNNIALIDILRKYFASDKISMNYQGVFDDTFTEQLILLVDSNVEKKTKKRMALLISESFQNIVRHGDSVIDGGEKSLFGIRGIDNFLHIFSSNSVCKSSKKFLEEKLDEINKLDKNELNVLYADALKSGTISSKGGAGLGLIEMARKSEQKIQKKFKKINEDHYAFYMQIDLRIYELTDEITQPEPISIKQNEVIQELINDHEIIFLYKGDFSPETMNPILNIMNQNTSDDTEDVIGFKIFHSSVELMQNIVRYGAMVDGKKEGIFSLNKTAKGYYLSTGNYIDGGSENFENFISTINNKEISELDQLYNTMLNKSALNSGKSSGIDLIDLRRSMLSKIDVAKAIDCNGTYLMIGLEIANT